MQTKIEPYKSAAWAYVLSLRDIRNVGLLVFTVIVLLISWSGVKSIQTNYGLQKQISKLQQQNDVQKLKNTNLALENQYLGTGQYLEVMARQNLGLIAPGETELLVSQDVALAHTIKQQETAIVSSEVPSRPFWQRNFQAWIDFFLHRNTGGS
ncbi:MAG TPA: septum formation initiator family protein [Candidatus Saccharimonadia bacterium]|nr:septum formation initiator family protein [Candidatus Saccharimonadia bacterium]